MEEFKDIIEGRNPVTEALRSGRAIDKIYVKKGDATLTRIIALANEKKIPVSYVFSEKLDEMIGKYSSDISGEDELYFTRGEMMKSYEDAAFGLEYPYAVSEVLETAEGFYVIMRLPMDEDYIMNHISELTNQYANVQFYNLIDEAQAKITIELNEYGKSIDLTKIK